MKPSNRSSLVLGLIVLLGLTGWVTQAQQNRRSQPEPPQAQPSQPEPPEKKSKVITSPPPSYPTSWEYRRFTIQQMALRGNTLPELGLQGWELVSIEHDIQEGHVVERYYYFKRARQQMP